MEIDSSLDSENQNFGSSKEQEIRAILRERFLWSCSALNGKEGSFVMHEGINVEGVCRGVDKDIMLMHMQNMKTPFTTYPYATVRLPDVLYANFKINK